jgi:hypothetical protein
MSDCVFSISDSRKISNFGFSISDFLTAKAAKKAQSSQRKISNDLFEAEGLFGTNPLLEGQGVGFWERAK